MIQQADLDRLHRELESLRGMVREDRPAAAASLDGLIRRASTLQAEARGTDFEPAVASIRQLLGALHGSLSAQNRLARAGARHAAS